MKQIELSKQGKYKGKYFAIVDDENFNKLNQFRWKVEQKNKKPNNVYAVADGMRMHRIIINAPQGVDVDHKNGNGLDNRKKNLRLCTLTENQANSKKRKNTSSKYKGVHWNKNRNKWQVQISFQNKHFLIGRFTSEIEAAKIYDIKAKELFGEFARTNF